ncbi:BapA/Bap/LapF family prefix-like domain-containing protein, partial [Acinetobacter beijerinckii]|uniref:BapA/Bap/LapF family prefix-like domain-containing protein n=1 Tax=Acinetobacter beijerinckii TaxID=262668 RepID=UPI004054A181
MSEIRVVSKESHETLETTTKDTVSISEASVVLIKVNKDDVSEIKQDGRNAIITLKNGEQIVIVNFFKGGNYSTDNSLVFEDNEHKLLWVQFTDSNGALLENITFSYIDKIEPLLYHDGVASPWAWLSVPLTAAGILWWANNDDDKSLSTQPKDTTPPAAPTDVAVSEDGTTVTGKGEPGTKVIIKDEDGNVIGEGTVKPDGTFEVELDEPLTNGEEITVGLEDQAGNKSPEVTVDAPDTTAPAAPTDVAVSEDGTTVTGKGEPGTK